MNTLKMNQSIHYFCNFLSRCRNPHYNAHPHFEHSGGTGQARAAMSVERSGGTRAGPSVHFESSGGTGASQDKPERPHFERSGGAGDGAGSHFDRSGGIGASPSSSLKYLGDNGSSPSGYFERQVALVV